MPVMPGSMFKLSTKTEKHKIRQLAICLSVTFVKQLSAGRNPKEYKQ